jgi:hypothetical protein
MENRVLAGYSRDIGVGANQISQIRIGQEDSWRTAAGEAGNFVGVILEGPAFSVDEEIVVQLKPVIWEPEVVLAKACLGLLVFKGSKRGFTDGVQRLFKSRSTRRR